NINWFDRNAHIELCGWKDKEARDNRCLYLDSRSFDFYKEEFDFVPDENLVEKSYNKIKAYKIKEVGEDGKEIERDGEFSDAKDC
ncbi:MAG: hypothetical protein QXO70_04990, partial [Candidatus Pacearchaeota archaeon]